MTPPSSLQALWSHFLARIFTLNGALFSTAIIADILLTVFGAYMVFRHERAAAGPSATFPHFFAYIMPRQVYLHRSAILDYQVWLLQKILGIPFSLPGIIGVTTIMAVLADGSNVGSKAATDSGAALTLMCAVTLVLAVDFSNYAGHFIQHRVKFFWEFHKIHHAAEVLTPITLDRTHPVEDIPKILISSSLFIVILFGFYCLRPIDVAETMTYGFNVLLWLRVLLFYRLRHSHVPMFFPDWLTAIFLSPVHHQTHHSSLARHFDRNYGQNLVIWDRLFGTLVAPEHPSLLRLGLSAAEEIQLNRSVFHLYALPFRNAWRLALPRNLTQSDSPGGAAPTGNPVGSESLIRTSGAP
jgi:sterol desaturase/sphingolipid hydroxylase (fatty acid hydroxylase superfamily)